MEAAKTESFTAGFPGPRWITEGVPDRKFPDTPLGPLPAMRLIEQELVLDGIPERNLATFVTTWMEPEVREVIVTTCTATSSITPSTPRRPRSSSAASVCSPTCSTPPAR